MRGSKSVVTPRLRLSSALYLSNGSIIPTSANENQLDSSVCSRCNEYFRALTPYNSTKEKAEWKN